MKQQGTNVNTQSQAMNTTILSAGTVNMQLYPKYETKGGRVEKKEPVLA